MRPERPIVAIAVTGSPWGPVRVAAGGRGVVAVALMDTEESFEAGLGRRGFAVAEGPPGPASAAAVLAGRTAGLLERLLAGEAAPLGTLPVDLSDRPAWDCLVLEAVRAIPRGETASYGEVARRIGRAGAARAVGGAVGRNPVGLVIPCHRVIAGDGTLGGYGVAAWGGREAALAVKRHLLAMEGVIAPGADRDPW